MAIARKTKPSEPMDDIDTRQANRNAMFLMADIRTTGGDDAVRAKVRNLSDGGMMAEGKLGLARGDEVRVELRNIDPVSGTVAWVQGERVGISFASTIDADAVRAAPAAANDSNFEPRRPLSTLARPVGKIHAI